MVEKNKIKKQVQLNLFTSMLASADLVATDSPGKAFYRIWIEETDGLIEVVKESGAKGRVLDRRRWPMETEEDARKLFKRQIRYKTNPARKSPRIYQLAEK